MRLARTTAYATAAALALTLSACGDDDETASTDVEVAEGCDEFDSGTTMLELCEAGEVTIGVKTDQPGIGFLEPGAEAPTGFDIEMGRIVAGALGIEDSGITWEETISDNREPFLVDGVVDIVIASYSITADRAKLVGQAGPYYVTGQQLLVRQEDAETIASPEDLEGVSVCSVTGSTSLTTVEDEYGAEPVAFDTYSQCVDALESGETDVLTTDGAILLGYEAENPDELQVTGEEFSVERYGIGYEKGDTAMCEFLTDTIEQSYENGTWEQAFESTLGQSGVETPKPPETDPCP
ncbi:MAG: glutamate ABC transporter substrate-binding protein [Nocardioidaceae bacterium]|nr:glutamate ABC transporter substrate-binding protein [Nocardioidaceae bacterium]